MKHQKQLATALLLAAACSLQAQRSETLLEKNWKFSKGDIKEASQPEFNDTQWESVVLPHDWAIFGPFDMNNDLQNVAITQNFEEKASLKTGRTGGLPYVGSGWYRTSFDTPADKEVTLLFDGAMSEARVYVNGKEACFWPFGYNSFHTGKRRLNCLDFHTKTFDRSKDLGNIVYNSNGGSGGHAEQF